MIIRDFHARDFDALVDCYRTGFPQGHNRYTLSRLVRFQRDTILVAEEQGQLVGTIIGITSHKEAWLTGLSVLPTAPAFQHTSMRLMHGLGSRFIEVGFSHAFATTGRRSVHALARLINASLVSVESNFYYDGEQKGLYKADMASLKSLEGYINQRLGT